MQPKFPRNTVSVHIFTPTTPSCTLLVVVMTLPYVPVAFPTASKKLTSGWRQIVWQWIRQRLMSWCFKSPTIRFTTYISGRYSSTFIRSAQSRRGVPQWLVNEGLCQSADSPLLQLSTSIKRCRRELTRITAATVVNSLIVRRLDYCISLLNFFLHLLCN